MEWNKAKTWSLNDKNILCTCQNLKCQEFYRRTQNIEIKLCAIFFWFGIFVLTTNCQRPCIIYQSCHCWLYAVWCGILWYETSWAIWIRRIEIKLDNRLIRYKIKRIFFTFFSAKVKLNNIVTNFIIILILLFLVQFLMQPFSCS